MRKLAIKDIKRHIEADLGFKVGNGEHLYENIDGEYFYFIDFVDMGKGFFIRHNKTRIDGETDGNCFSTQKKLADSYADFENYANIENFAYARGYTDEPARLF